MPIIIIADDLTGAADTGVQFAKLGFYTILLSTDEIPQDIGQLYPSVITINTNTRNLPPELAYEKIRAISKKIGELNTQIIYKKIDSTLRGNLGSEIQSILENTKYEFAVVSPAFPANKRITINGIHLVDGRPISNTEAAFDPVKPVKSSYIPDIIKSQTKLKSGHINIDEIRTGHNNLKSLILQHVENGEKIIALDATSDQDLMIIVHSCMSILPPPLMVGSAGLAAQLSNFLRPWDLIQDRLSQGKEKHDGIVIIISGSLSSVTKEQVDQVKKTGKAQILSLEIHKFVKNGNSKWIDDIANEIISFSKRFPIIGIQSIVKDQNPENDLSDLIAEALGCIGACIVKGCPRPIAGIILTGGDTALSVFKNLKIHQVRLIDEILPGIPYGEILNSEFANIKIITKAGAFGDKNALLKCTAHLNKLNFGKVE